MTGSRFDRGDAALLLLLAFVSSALQWPAFQLGSGNLHNDLALYPLSAWDIADGSFRTYSFSQGYGGLLLTYARALAMGIARAFGSDPVRASFAFSHFVVPLLLLVPLYCASRRVSSRFAAALVALVAVAGTRFYAEQLHNDFYPPVWILTFTLAAAGGFQGGAKARFVLGVFAGLCLYTHRLSVVPIAAFLIPWGRTAEALRAVLASVRLPGSKWEAALSRAGAALFGLGVFLWLFGDRHVLPGLGSVRVDVFPNLKYGTALLAVSPLFLARARVLAWVKEHAWTFAGLLLGWSPELLYRLRSFLASGSFSFQESYFHFNSWKEASVLLGSVPDALLFLFGSFPGLLAIAVLFFLRPRLPALRAGILLSVAIYALFRHHELVVHRYLFPLWGFVLLAWAEALGREPAPRIVRHALAVFLLFLFAAQANERLRGPDLPRADAKREELRRILALPGFFDAPYVFSEDYAYTYLLTLEAGRRVEVHPSREDVILDRRALGRAAKEDFASFYSRGGREASGELVIHGVSWCVSGLRARDPELGSLYALHKKKGASCAATPCSIREGGDGVPELRADSIEELHFCWGKAHARDRADQMRRLRAISRGARAEIEGASALRDDVTLRLLDLEARAEVLGKMLAGSVWERELRRYADGVNAEAPGLRWKPSDSIALLLLQSFDQTRKGLTGRVRAELARVRGEPLPPPVSEEGAPWFTPILKDGEGPVISRRAGGGASAGAPVLPAPDLPEGSNNWVVSPRSGKSRHAWLANDPHLALQDPPFWHVVRLRAEGRAAFGAALPGVPLLASGMNRDLAWGLTNSYLPAIRLEVLPRPSVRLRDARPVFWFRLGFLSLPYFFQRIERDESGNPLLPLSEVPEDEAWVVHWGGFHVTGEGLAPLARIWRARSAREAEGLFAESELPSWNFVFADRSGEIGFRAIGKVFRNGASGADPVFLRPDEMPAVFAPGRGWIASANQPHAGGERAPLYRGAQSLSFRAFRIEERLKEAPRFDFESLRAIQCDDQAVDARFLLPRLLKLVEGEPLADLLASWDFRASVGCVPCALYRRWMDELHSRIPGGELSLFRAAGDPALRETVVSAFREAARFFSDLPHATPWGELHRAPFAGGIPSPGDEHSVNPGTARWDGGARAWRQTHGASFRLLVELSDPPRAWWALAGPTPESWKKWAGCEYARVDL